MRRDTDNPPPMHPDERALAVLCHVSTIVPLWAILSNALIYFSYRERSRAVCFHARQGINFQLLFLLVVAVKCLLDLVARLIGLIGALEKFPETVNNFGTIAVALIFFGYLVVCLLGVVRAIQGRFLVYPRVGERRWRDFNKDRG